MKPSSEQFLSCLMQLSVGIALHVVRTPYIVADLTVKGHKDFRAAFKQFVVVIVPHDVAGRHHSNIELMQSRGRGVQLRLEHIAARVRTVFEEIAHIHVQKWVVVLSIE